jgi:hypothetical protein
MEVVDLNSRGFRFIKAVFQYSAGVASLPGFQIVRVRLHRWLPLTEGLKLVEDTIRAAGRPLTAFCACELRSPAPFTEDGFKAFNKVYIDGLKLWDLLDNDINPIARSNVCPAIAPPSEPSLFAFSYTVPTKTPDASFIISGGGEVPEGKTNYLDHIVRFRDLSREGLLEKARYVHAAMEARMQALGFSWSSTTATQLYTVHDIHPFIQDEIVLRGAARAGLSWHFCRPPIVDVEYEMDCRRITAEVML